MGGWNWGTHFFLVWLLCRQTRGMHLQGGQQLQNEVVQNHSFSDYGPAVRDMNKTHKTEPPKLGSLYPMSPIFLIERDVYPTLVKS